jgi:hypothetical protein
MKKITNFIRHLNRKILVKIPELNEEQNKWLAELELRGQVVIPDFISKETMSLISSQFQSNLEKGEFETPVLSQSKIDPLKHERQINNYLLGSPKEYLKDGLAFERKDFKNLDQAIIEFKPSTLKCLIPKDSKAHFMLWLDDKILDVIEAYMGLRPHLVEAYQRRNYPAKYKVMNHFWHRDLNHPRHLLKVFFFFTDCKIENGPHYFVEGSHKNRTLDGKPYFTDDEVNLVHTNEIRAGVVKAGTLIIEDTRGIHKAGLPTEGFRDVGYGVFLPYSWLSRRRKSYFKVSSDVFHSLSTRQKGYIPPENIV